MPTNKRYSLNAALKEFNQIYLANFALLPSVSNCTLVRNFENDTFHVLYDAMGYVSRQKGTLQVFAYYKISTSFPISRFRAMMLQKEPSKPSPKIEIWPSSKIRYAYLQDNTFANKGHLGNSCMRYKENQKSLNFYVKNNVRIVVVTDDKNKIYARALLWEGVKTTSRKSTVTYLDRVYAISDTYRLQLNTLASENKWHSYNSPSAGKARGTYYIDNIDIKGICHLPYTDTFRFLFYKDGVVSSSISTTTMDKANIKHGSDCVTLTQTSNGGYTPALDADRVKEALTNNYVSKKDCIRVKRYNGYVLKKNIVNIGGDYYSKHDNKIIESKLDGFILAKNAVSEAVTNETIDKTKAIKSVKYNGYIHKSNVVNIKDTLYHNKDTDIIHYEGTWYHISQCFINYSREKANEELASLTPYRIDPLPCYVLRETVTRKDGLIPKERAVIAYDLIHNPVTGNIEYQVVYCTGTSSLIQLITGEFIVNSSKNKTHLKKFNGKYYIKKEFKSPNKKQLILFEGIK